MKLVTLLITILLISFACLAQEIAYFDRSFNKRTHCKHMNNKRLYFVKDSVVETEDYNREKIYRKGNFTEFQPINLSSYNFEKKAIMRLKQMPAWYPAILNNKPVKTRFRIPVTFRLQ